MLRVGLFRLGGGATGMPRLFVSVDLPATLAGEFAAVQQELEDVEALRFTDPAQAHLTVKFLGDVDEDRVDDVVAALERAVDDAGVEPFEAEVGGVGAFPSPEYINVVWVGVGDGADELARLHEAVERETTALGFEPEEHDFTPHLTLARMDDARGKATVQAFLDEEPVVGRFDVDAIRLTESTLTDDGPVYETVESIPLPA